MQAVDSKISKYLFENLGEEVFNSERLELSSLYDFHCVSVFSHFLNDEEAEKFTLFYQSAIDNPNTPETTEYFKYHDKIIRFYLDLYSITKVYGVFDHLFVIFDSIDEYKSHIILSVREQLFIKLVMPEFSTIAEGGYDLKQLFYTLKSDPDGIKNLKSIVEANDLFLLS